MKRNFLAMIVYVISIMISLVSARHIPNRALNGTLRLAYLMSWSHEWPVGPFIGSSIIIGIEEVRKRHLLDEYGITWTHRDTHCEPRRGMTMLIDIWDSSPDLDGIIGADCSVVCQPVSLLAAAWNVPSISYGCSSDALSDKTAHPTFSRSTGVYVHLAPMFVAMAETFNWRRVGLITDLADLFRNSANVIKRVLEKNNITVAYYTAETSITGDTVNEVNLIKMRNILKLLRDQVRIIIVFLYPQDLRVIHIEALSYGMLDGRYVFIGLDSANLVSDEITYRPEFGVDLLQGMIDTTPADNDGPVWDEFRYKIIDAFQDPAFDHLPHLQPGDDINQIESYAGMVHDAVLMWAYGVNKTLEQGYPPDDGLKVTENIFNLTFEGITGVVAIDEKGDRKPNYKIEMVQNGKMVTIMEWLAAEGRMKKVYKPDDPNDWSGLLWSGNSTVPPKDAPDCGWNNEFCAEEDGRTQIIIIVSSVVACVILALAVGVGYGYRKIRYENDLKEATSCCVSWNEIQLNNRVTSRLSMRSEQSGGSMVQKSFIETGKLKNDVVAIKTLGTSPVDLTDRRVLVELKAMKDIKHENVNGFIGVCMEQPRVCVLMTYAPRGSLQDVLGDDTIKLTWDFKLSLVTDIAQGMKYLHSTVIGSHGHLTSKNCVVDSRWTCKITDYGLDLVKFLANSTNEDKLMETDSQLIWTAPELLRMRQPPLAGTQKGDIYSFSITAQEIVLQDVPYAENFPQEDENTIIELVRSGHVPPYRPFLTEEHCGPLWLEMMSKCWNENPDGRPNFLGVMTLIRNINGGKEVKLVDNMINRLESHTKHLEEIVAERTKELQEEKSKMEILLAELLPKSVADKLKSGHQIAPESFDNVTIFFSDIVSFTRISAAGTPIDVVRMLNLMYTLFDDIAAKFDVYKVATIGDAYFVASGVPIRNDDKHAAEICGMALELLNGVKHFPVPHLPEETLKLRIGIHSGPCVAGVAGMKMPRYLLFGDTVDIASRFESGGESMRIHISYITKDLLARTGGFKFEERGEADIKGLGVTLTYWLNSRG